MPLEAVTFDFHNTLAHCDQWFQHEIRTLVPTVLSRQATQSGQKVDGDLLDRAAQAYRALRRGVIEHGEEMDATACVCHVMAELGLAVDEGAICATIDDIMLACLDDAQPVGGSVETVTMLANAGVRLGVVSAAVHHPFLEWSLEKFGILDAFDVVVTSASAGYYKTRPELYLHTLEHLKAAPANSVHIGDSHRFDVEGARRAGMRTVWFATNGNEESVIENVADLTVNDLRGLAPILQARFGSAR